MEQAPSLKINHGIGCVKCCVSVGHVQLDLGEEYKGHDYYGMICARCIEESVEMETENQTQITNEES